MRKRHGVAGVPSLFWVAGTAMVLLGLSVLIVKQQNLPLDLGLVRTRGLEGLWATLLPGMVGLAGAGLVAAYSGYWTILLASGVPVGWNAMSSFRLNGPGICTTVPWLGRAVVLGLVSAFA